MIQLKMFRISFLNIFFMLLFLMESEASSSILLKRQSLIYHEPPFENIFLKKKDPITEHYITQRFDHFDRQNNQTFQMVLINSQYTH